MSNSNYYVDLMLRKKKLVERKDRNLTMLAEYKRYKPGCGPIWVGYTPGNVGAHMYSDSHTEIQRKLREDLKNIEVELAKLDAEIYKLSTEPLHPREELE